MKNKTFVYCFEKLDVWILSRELNNYVYDITDGFPFKEEKNLKIQIRRSSVSISSNIAEGSGKLSKKDFKRYLQISFGSAMELLSQFYLAFDRKYIDDKMLNEIKMKINSITRMLNSLSQSLN